MKFRIAALICLVVMVAAACGARLDANQRKVALQAYAAGATGGGGTVPGAVPTVGASGGPVTGPSSGPSTGPSSGPGSGGGGSAACAAAAGGNKATDTGVTPTQITIGTVSDLSGIQPGLFKSTTDAVAAAAAYINSQGGICGRQVKDVPYDSQETSSGDKAATQDACQASFALVGSMSAFDDGGASVVDSCGVPDMTAITTNSARAFAHNTYAMYQVRPDQYLQGTARYIKSKFGDTVIKHAAILWLNSGVTKTNASVRKKGEEDNGYHFVYTKEVQVVETNYTSYVIQMKDAGVQYVTMVADYQSIIRLCQAMQQQSWYPKVMDWDSVVYSPKFLEQANGAANNSLFFINTAMLEEASSNPEMQLYEQWLQRVDPGTTPDYFGLYAWSAARLFQQLASKIGPDLTRAKLFAALKATHSWDGHGLHAAHDIGNKTASNCFLYGKVTTNSFVRYFPSSGWTCDYGPLLNT